MSEVRRLPRPDTESGRRLRAFYERVAATALEEDLGGGAPEADATTVGVVPEDLHGEGAVVAKAAGVVCGLESLEAVFNLVRPGAIVRHERVDGDRVAAADVLARVEGPVRVLLTGERCALNLLGHLSGIATLTAEFVRRATDVTVTDTRKTLPGLRVLEKYAVRVGGGENHRTALWDGVLVKDNHIVAAGGVGEATRRAKMSTTMPVQIECASSEDVDAALEAGADALLLDNMDPNALGALVERIRGAAPGVLVEVSGGVALDTVSEIARTGVDRISVGALTHSAPALDVSFRLERVFTGGG